MKRIVGILASGCRAGPSGLWSCVESAESAFPISYLKRRVITPDFDRDVSCCGIMRYRIERERPVSGGWLPATSREPPRRYAALQISELSANSSRARGVTARKDTRDSSSS